MLKNAFERASHVEKEFDSSFYSQLLVLTFREHQRSYSQMAPVGVSSSLIVLHFARKVQRCIALLFIM